MKKEQKKKKRKSLDENELNNVIGGAISHRPERSTPFTRNTAVRPQKQSRDI